MRTVYELTQIWPIAQARYRHFGLATHWLYTISHFFPSFLLSLAARFMALFQPNKPKLQSLNRNPLFPTVLLSWLQSFSYCHRVSLGGPIQVQEFVLRDSVLTAVRRSCYCPGRSAGKGNGKSFSLLVWLLRFLLCSFIDPDRLIGYTTRPNKATI